MPVTPFVPLSISGRIFFICVGFFFFFFYIWGKKLRYMNFIIEKYDELSETGKFLNRLISSSFGFLYFAVKVRRNIII